MNIFVILIMGIMLATYQYFTAKRSSDVALNKDELHIQAEITCMKQFFDFASAKNESLRTEVPSLKGTEEGKANYTCTGSDDVNVSKYCISASGTKISCTSPEVFEHCVATTKWKQFVKSDKYLIPQIMKSGVSIIPEEGGLKVGNMKKYIPIPVAPQKSKEKTNTLIGMINCISADVINKQRKMEGNSCAEGTYAVQQENGQITCEQISDISPCTAHEQEVDKLPNNVPECNDQDEKCCTKLISGKYCCPKENIITCSDGKEKIVWKHLLRFWTCTTGEEYCKENGTMYIKDDKDNLISSKTITKPFTPQYKESSGGFVCNLKSHLYTETCKNQQNSDYAFFGVEGLDKQIAQGQTNNAENIPVCRLSAKINSKAIENCTSCETTVFDKTNNKWVCQPYTWNTGINRLKNNSTIIQTLKGTVAGEYNAKGLKGCFIDCTAEEMEQILAGKRNGYNWGLVYNNSTRMWSCVHCNTKTTYNNRCTGCKLSDPASTCSCTDQESQGKCVPYTCSTEYQVLLDGICYTKWCNRSILPPNTTIGEPRSRNCPKTANWMKYNEIKTCVYCVRPPTDKISEITE